MPKGKIIKALSGFYYVQHEKDIVQCRGRGLFRKQKITPLVGDDVTFEYTDEGEGSITAIDNRKNELSRPRVANIDQAIIVTSAKEPTWRSYLMDKFLVMIEAKEVEPVLFVTKMDLLTEQEKEHVIQTFSYYQTIGYQVLFLSNEDGIDSDDVAPILDRKISVFAGQSGVGKTSLLNTLIPGLKLETGDISQSLGRGKHTTRHVEFIRFENGYIADTPGFSALDFSEVDLDLLPACFPEFVNIQDECKFRGCLHLKEPHCAVKKAVDNGDIRSERYQNYVQFIEEIQQRKPRY
ncbi:GTPase RsgA [Gracilibacillus halophilus YIM-C55.5]|uniref:Small ribosomal subunit biogenesis GTPase RsgA n=1 Tax=Gracilibacillus halophilus YIM-C55.5 TaxID=1308866 RepID=N4WDB4_9BACI|nr:ribosome small subunit-dependent GTPase A [Gracilibacillus halophilus]ENH98283.1 GTPase RsgA [Gracilibacillus halophilus YIM-C55.5]